MDIMMAVVSSSILYLKAGIHPTQIQEQQAAIRLQLRLGIDRAAVTDKTAAVPHHKADAIILALVVIPAAPATRVGFFRHRAASP